MGWASFSIALIVYSLTVEPTMSYWDCGEYISTAAKLEVGHPPGAPLFQMVGAFFAMFASGPDKIALMVNMVSVLSSAFTILFMYWSSTIVLKNIVSSYSTLGDNSTKMILGSAFIGAIAFTFTDTFWYSAVEAEVYAMTSLFIALTMWAGLKWGEEMHEPRGNRWLLLISLLIGLSFGVHFLVLLTIPSIGFIYYFKNYNKITLKNFIIANITIVGVLFFVFKFLLPYTLALFAKTEIFAVNSFGLPFNSGIILLAIALIAFFYFGLTYTKKKNLPGYNTALLSILFIFIGFSAWMMLPIRANANVVINENKPSDAAEVLAYYNREQYGEQKVFYGPMYTDAYAGVDQNNPYQDEKPNYERDYKTGKYTIVNNYKNAIQNGDDAQNGILPRMQSDKHAANYMDYTEAPQFRLNPNYDYTQDLMQYGIDLDSASEEEVMHAINQIHGELENIISQFKAAYKSGQLGNEEYDKFLSNYKRYLIVEKPSFASNMKFMFEYQFGYMYWRYFMWNFTGRQNDIQGKNTNINGNWISGIKAIDEARLGPQDHLTSEMLNNKGRNIYYFLPLALGLIGMLFHAKKDLKGFYVLFVLFIFMSIALKVFLNEKPFEVRERDYVLVGSFYAFAIWIGLGVYGIYDFAKKYLQPKVLIPATLMVTFLAVPFLLAKENWDDHDRSGKYTAPAMAKMFLDSCEPNAILFTIADNDTFPVWYAQEVEAYRRDVRAACSTLLPTDWHIDQMKRKAYTSDPLPISLTHDQYVDGTRDFLLYNPRTDARIEIDTFMDFVTSTDERAMLELNNGHKANFYPSNKIRIPVDREAVIKNKVVSPEDYDNIAPYIDIDLPKDAIYKHHLVILDIIRNNKWKRPVYFSTGSVDDEDYVWLKDYLQLDGLVYKLVPIKTPVPKDSPFEIGRIDTTKMYNIVMKWDWGKSNDPRIYHDPETRRTSFKYRTTLARLTEALINEGKTEKAKNVINLAMTQMPLEQYGYHFLAEPFAEGYYKVGEKLKARQTLDKIIKQYQEDITYYKSIHVMGDIEGYYNLLLMMKENNDTEFYNSRIGEFNKYAKMFPGYKPEST